MCVDSSLGLKHMRKRNTMTWVGKWRKLLRVRKIGGGKIKFIVTECFESSGSCSLPHLQMLTVLLTYYFKRVNASKRG